MWWWCDIAVLLVAVKGGRGREKERGREGGGERRGYLSFQYSLLGHVISDLISSLRLYLLKALPHPNSDRLETSSSTHWPSGAIQEPNYCSNCGRNSNFSPTGCILSEQLGNGCWCPGHSSHPGPLPVTCVREVTNNLTPVRNYDE